MINLKPAFLQKLYCQILIQIKELSLPEGEGFTAVIRKGFFNYLIDLGTSDQMVIIENTKHHELSALMQDENKKIISLLSFKKVDMVS